MGWSRPSPATCRCSPTWAQPSADGAKIFVACNKASDIVEIDAASWTMTRRLPAGDGVYNLAVTHDGKLLVATNKRGQSVSVVRARERTGSSSGCPPSGRSSTASPSHRDDRYAFVSVEGVGSQPGTVEMIDLRALATVATRRRRPDGRRDRRLEGGVVRLSPPPPASRAPRRSESATAPASVPMITPSDSPMGT